MPRSAVIPRCFDPRLPAVSPWDSGPSGPSMPLILATTTPASRRSSPRCRAKVPRPASPAPSCGCRAATSPARGATPPTPGASPATTDRTVIDRKAEPGDAERSRRSPRGSPRWARTGWWSPAASRCSRPPRSPGCWRCCPGITVEIETNGTVAPPPALDALVAPVQRQPQAQPFGQSASIWL